MLALIGIGLDTKDISLRALEAIKNSDTVLCDRYTSVISNDALSFIKEHTGKEISQISRSDLEENVGKTIGDAATKNVSILVIGDPLVATTHHIIMQEARKLKIQTKVFHSSSVFSAAIGESGLDIYKFGPTTTIPFWSQNYHPTSFIDVISRNMENGQHTLVLLDIDQKTGEPMAIEEAHKILTAAISPQYRVNEDTKILILGDLGRESQSIISTTISKLKGTASSFKGKTLCIIVPAKTNFAEEEELSKFIPV